MKKSSHSFLCRDDVWERVEALAKHREVTTDDVVQAALVQLFVRKRRPPPPVVPAGGSSTLPPIAPGARPFEASNAGDVGDSMSRTIPDFAMTESQTADFASGMRSRTPAPSSVPASDRPLYLQCDGEWYAIDKEEFVIGRGKKYSDLAIKDANISRRHCAITRIEGRYYMRDLGSTNGIEQGGVRVNDHEILEQSVFHLCSHELRFSFQEPPGPVIEVGA